MFKENCRILYEKMLDSQFSSLMCMVLQHTKERAPKFFKSLDYIKEIISKAFMLLKEKKLDYFDQNSIKTIISGDQEHFMLLKNKPKLLGKK